MDELTDITSPPSVCHIASSIVTIENAIVLVQGDREVAHIDAKYDFSDVNPAYHGIIINLLLGHRIRLRLATSERREEAVNYEKREAEYNQLPWWKKLFAHRPRLYESAGK